MMASSAHLSSKEGERARKIFFGNAFRKGVPELFWVNIAFLNSFQGESGDDGIIGAKGMKGMPVCNNLNPHTDLKLSTRLDLPPPSSPIQYG